MRNVTSCRYLLVVLGDQLNRDSLLWEKADPAHDRVFMAEVLGEIDRSRCQASSAPCCF